MSASQQFWRNPNGLSNKSVWPLPCRTCPTFLALAEKSAPIRQFAADDILGKRGISRLPWNRINYQHAFPDLQLSVPRIDINLTNPASHAGTFRRGILYVRIGGQLFTLDVCSKCVALCQMSRVDPARRLKVGGQPFCAMHAARRLAEEAREVGGGSLFSVAIVFARIEYESWLIAGASSLGGKSFSDGRKELPAVIRPPQSDLEIAPRDAKGWFRSVMQTGYKPTRDQAELTRLVDLDLIRQREMRSFRRLEAAIQELVGAIRSGNHAVTPTLDP